MKIACDFVSLDNLSETLRLFDEFRGHRLSTGVGDDVLQLFNMLWYAWVSLSWMRDANIALQGNMSDSEDFDTGDGSVVSAESAANACDVDLNPHSMSSVGKSMTARQLRKILRRRGNNKHKKEIKAYAAAPYIEGHDFKCDFCPRMFDRAGILMHLCGIIILSFCSCLTDNTLQQGKTQGSDSSDPRQRQKTP
jgi:hypothetical protein